MPSMSEKLRRHVVAVHVTLSESFLQIYRDSFSSIKATVVLGVAVLSIVMALPLLYEVIVGSSGKWRLHITTPIAAVVSLLIVVAIEVSLTPSRLTAAQKSFHQASRASRILRTLATWSVIFCVVGLLIVLASAAAKQRAQGQ